MNFRMRISRLEVMGFILMFAWLIKYLVEPLYDYDLFIVGFVLVLVSNGVEVYNDIKQKVFNKHSYYLYYVAFYNPTTDKLDLSFNYISIHSIEYLMDDKNISEIRTDLSVAPNYELDSITYLGEVKKK